MPPLIPARPSVPPFPLQDAEGVSPLQAACQIGHMEVVGTLLSGGAGTDLQDAEGTSPLHVACQMGHVDLVQALLSAVSTLSPS